jgi:hypothetical protein
MYRSTFVGDFLGRYFWLPCRYGPAIRTALLIICMLSAISAESGAADIAAATDVEFHVALKQARPGDHIRLGGGPYTGGYFSVGLAGTEDRPIRISGPSPEKPAVITGEIGGVLQLIGASYVVVENLHITKARGHGLAIDDGGKKDFSCHHITIRNVRIEDIGPEGTMCSIKMAGVSDFTIADCTFQKWGEGGGCAIDGVGCKNGLVDRCTFLSGRGSVAVQFKGSSESVDIRRCFFDDPSPIGINVGGMTGEAFFRPKPLGFEARNIIVEGNVFIGCDAPVCFPNTDGADVRFNTIYLPRKWAFRILQQTNLPDFTPSRNGRIEDNIIVFHGGKWLEGGINVGANTAPQTFHFARNFWYSADNPAKSAPRLPTPETDPMVGKDPLFVDAANNDLRLKPASPANGKGHTGFKGVQASP